VAIDGTTLQVRGLYCLDGTPLIAAIGKSWDCSVRHNTCGRAAAINRGVQEATAPIICVLHGDTLLPDDAVAVMRRVLADRPVASVQ